MKHKWILVAEDDPNDADLTIRALMSDSMQSGPEIVIARDGSEALDSLYHRQRFQFRDYGNPVLILLDLKMPKVDGKEVLQKIKADSRLRTIPVVVFTSSREEADLAECYQSGANAYVVKPVDFTEFVAALKRLGEFWTAVNEPPPELNNALDINLEQAPVELHLEPELHPANSPASA